MINKKLICKVTCFTLTKTKSHGFIEESFTYALFSNMQNSQMRYLHIF